MRHPANCLLAVVAVLWLAAPSAAQPIRCTAQTVVGTYALAVQGATLVTPPGGTPTAAPFASLAIVGIDEGGRISGTGYGAFGGQVGQAPVEGTIEVHPDCTAIVRTTAGTLSTDVILDGGDALTALMIGFPVGKPLLQGTARRISRAPGAGMAPNCSAETVRGTYAAAYQGTYLMPTPVPAQTLALVIVGPDGQVSGGGTIAMGGNALPYEILNGHLDVNADCTASVALTVRSGALADEGTSWLVLVNGGDELWAIQTESRVAKPIVAGVWRRVRAAGIGQPQGRVQ